MKKTICLATTAVLALTLAGAAAVHALADDSKEITKKDAGKGSDCYKFVAPLSDLMEVMESIFTKMPDKLKAEKFKDLRRESHFIAEFANLVTHEGEHHTNKEWLAFLDNMKSEALKMAEAAKKSDAAGWKTAYGVVEKTCDSCHEKFRDN